MQFNLTIESDNDAMTDDEIVRLLRQTATRIAHEGQTEGRLLDINGNTVGSWELVS